TDIDLSLRIFGAVIGMGGLVALWSTKRLVNRQAPLLSLALYGLNATVIVWGDSVRGYGLAALLILLLYGLIWKLASGPTPMRIALAACVSILSVQCSYQNAFLVFAICVSGCLVCWRRRLWSGILAILSVGAVAALSLLIYVPMIVGVQQFWALAQFPFEFS